MPTVRLRYGRVRPRDNRARFRALATVLVWCTGRPSRVRTLATHLIDFLLHLAPARGLVSSQHWGATSSWLRGELVFDTNLR